MKKSSLLLIFIVLIAAFLRLYKLDQNPPSLYWDEASLGYNAFSILTTGHDEHGEYFPLARFIAFGDYKPPGYIYLIVPFMAIFGINEFAIRFPSTLSGILMVILTFFLVNKLFNDEKAGLISAFLLSISPWDLQLSRVAYEAHLAALFNLIAILLFIYGLRKRWLLPVSSIFFILSFYTFNANRILAPLFVLLLVSIYRKDLFATIEQSSNGIINAIVNHIQSQKYLILSVFIAVLLLFPSISYLRTRESRLRFQEVSIFTSLDVVKKANERIERSGNAWWAKLLFNRRVMFIREFLVHYLDNFKGDFLFVTGDRNPRLSVQGMGELYVFELPFLAVGLIYLIKQIGKRNKTPLLLFGWMLIAPIPAGMARETPHALRIDSILPVFQIIETIGAIYIWSFLKGLNKVWIKLAVMGIFIILASGNIFYYFHNYWVHYPVTWASEWQYGYKQMVQKVATSEAGFDRVNISSQYGRPYIYFLLYNKINPLVYVKERRAERDWFGLWNVDGFGKYDFVSTVYPEGIKVLKVTGPGGINQNKLIDKVEDLNGKTVFEIGEF